MQKKQRREQARGAEMKEKVSTITEYLETNADAYPHRALTWDPPFVLSEADELHHSGDAKDMHDVAQDAGGSRCIRHRQVPHDSAHL